jgi:hypothetical protein
VARYTQALARASERTSATAGQRVAAPRVAATFGTELATEAMGPLVLQRRRASVRSDALGFELEARAERTDSRWRDRPIDVGETGVLLRAGSAVLGGWSEVSGGFRLRVDRNLAQAGLAHTRRLSPWVEGRLEASLNEPADETAPLRLDGVRRRVGGALTLSAGRIYARAGAEWKSWSLRTGDGVGSGGVASMELGATMELGGAEVRVRLTSNHQRNSLRMSSGPATLAALGPLLPTALTTFGIGATVSRWSLGPAQLVTDVWVGALSPPVRPAYRVQAGLATTPFAAAELSLAGFVADDRFGGGGTRGAIASLSYRFRGL